MKPFHLLDPNLPDPIPDGICALAVMTKAPRAGRVKTRLVPPLTAEEAAELNRCFLRDTITTLSLCCCGGLRRPKTASARPAPGPHRAPRQCRGIAVYTPIGCELAYVDILPDGFS